MRDASRVVLGDLHAKLVGFQLHQLNLPLSIENRLENIELQKQNARLKTAELTLTKEQAETDRVLAEVGAAWRRAAPPTPTPRAR